MTGQPIRIGTKGTYPIFANHVRIDIPVTVTAESGERIHILADDLKAHWIGLELPMRCMWIERTDKLFTIRESTHNENQPSELGLRT